eukprot:jgi/Picsp_1/6119/NSC_03473-R1_hypothetical protein CHLNCDRAFT_144879 [Chlorella variabilis]
MVRFHWGETGCYTYTPVDGIEEDETNGIVNIKCEMELSGQNETCPALLTLPLGYIEGGLERTGVVIAHGEEADDYLREPVSSLAVHLARQGYLVMRYFCRQKEQRRQRIFERTVEAADASPYARNIKKWVYVGYGNGARIAASVGYKSLKPKDGFVFVSYPWMEPMPPPPKQKSGTPAPVDSLGPLFRLAESAKAPHLYISGSLDSNCEFDQLRTLGGVVSSSGIDARVCIISGVDEKLCAKQKQKIAVPVVKEMNTLVQRFLESLTEGQAFSEGVELKNVK